MDSLIRDKVVAVKYNGRGLQHMGKFWGVLYEDGHSCSEGWTDDPTKVTLGDERFCRKPTDMTWAGSHYTRDLMLGKIVPVTLTTTLREI